MGWKDKFRRVDRGVEKTEDVLIVILAGGQSLHASLVPLAVECARLSAEPHHRFTFDLLTVCTSPQERARNTACGMALERLKRPEDTLLMIDNDMIWLGSKSLRLLTTKNYDIAGGLQYMWFPKDHVTGQPPRAWPCAFMRKESGVGMESVTPAAGEVQREVDRVGSGFMAIKRRVLADTRMLLAEGYDPPAMWRNVYQPNFVRDKGLDMDYCDRAKALGYRIVVNWTAEVGHNKHVSINEIDEYAKTQAMAGYEAGVNHALQMVAGSRGQAEGPDGESGPHVDGDEGVGGMGLDRADRPAEVAASA